MCAVLLPPGVNPISFKYIPYQRVNNYYAVFADDITILEGSVNTVKENAETLVVATKEIGLEVNADETKYMVMSWDRNAGRGHGVKIDNSSIEMVEEFKYLGATLTDQNSIQEEIKSRLKLGNACYHSVQKLLSSRLLSRNLKIKIYRTIIFPVVLYDVTLITIQANQDGLKLKWYAPASGLCR
jgi:hypothetical protein